jgi:hypothetical protein
MALKTAPKVKELSVSIDQLIRDCDCSHLPAPEWQLSKHYLAKARHVDKNVVEQELRARSASTYDRVYLLVARKNVVKAVRIQGHPDLTQHRPYVGWVAEFKDGSGERGLFFPACGRLTGYVLQHVIVGGSKEWGVLVNQEGDVLCGDPNCGCHAAECPCSAHLE